MIKHLLLGSGSSFLISLISLIITARLFSLEFIAEFKAITIYVGIISSVFTFQLHSAFLYYSGEINKYQEKTVFLLIFLISILGALCFYFFYDLLNPNTNLDSTSKLLFSIFTFYNVLFIMSPAIFTSKNSSKEIPLFMLLYTGMALISLFITYLFFTSIKVYIIIYVILLSIVFFFSLWKIVLLESVLSIQIESISKIIVYSKKIFLSNLFDSMSDKVDKIFANWVFKSVLFAKYSVVSFENPLVNLLLNSYGIKAVKEYKNNNGSCSFKKFWENATREITFITYPISAFLFFYSEFVISLLFGERFVDFAVVFQIYALVTLLRPVPFQALLRMENLVKYNIYISILFIITSILSGLVIINFFNLLYLPFSYFFGWLVYNSFALYFLLLKRNMYSFFNVVNLKVILIRFLQSYILCYLLVLIFGNSLLSLLLFMILYICFIFILKKITRKNNFKIKKFLIC